MEELDLKELFNIFWSKKIIIIFIVILFAGLGAAYSYFYVTPKYKAYTTLVLTTSSDNQANSAETITTTDITLNNSLVATYSELAKSTTVVREVISNLMLTDTEASLKGKISVSAVKSTQLIEIDVVDEYPEKAAVVANEVAKAFAKKVSELYNINNVQVVDKAEAPTEPYNINHKKNIAIFAGIGLVLACGYVFILSLVDTTVKGKEEVEKKLGLTVLVSIPKCDFDKSIKVVNNKRKGGNS